MTKRLNYTKADLGASFAMAVMIMLFCNLALGLVSIEQNWWTWVSNAIFSLLLGGGAFVYAQITRVNFVVATSLNKKPQLAHLGWGALAVLCIILAMTPINEWLLDAIESIGLSRPSVNLPMDLAGLLVVATLIPSFTEEILFRGTMCSALKNANKIVAVVVGGALFSLFHLNPAQTLHQFVLGYVFTLLFLRSGSMWVTVILHFFNNLVAAVVSYVLYINPQANVAFGEFVAQNGIWMAIVGLVGCGLAMFGYVKTTKSNWQQQKEEGNANASYFMLFVGVAVCVVFWVLNLVVKNEG